MKEGNITMAHGSLSIEESDTFGRDTDNDNNREAPSGNFQTSGHLGMQAITWERKMSNVKSPPL